MAAQESADSAAAVDGSDTYKIDRRHMGLAIIVNNYKFKDNTERKSGEKDSETLKRMFRQIGYKSDNIIIIENQTTSQLNLQFDKIKSEQIKKRHSTFVLCLMSRVDGNKIMDYEGNYMNVDEDILSKFCDQSCTLLAGKPKLILTQTGVEGPLRSEYGRPVEIEGLSIPEWSDVLVLRIGRLRKPEEGSVFLPIFCDFCQQYYSSTPVTDIVTLAINKVASEDVTVNKKDVKELAAINWNTLRKKFYLSPVEQDETRMMYDLKDGVAVIFLNFEFKSIEDWYRQGSKVDVKNFKTLCKKWNYTFDEQIDLTDVQVKEYFKEENLKKKFKKHSCAIIIVSSHGELDAKDEKYKFLTRGQSLDVENFIETTRNALHKTFIRPECPTVYLFSTCHGKELLEREEKDEEDEADDPNRKKKNMEVEIDAAPKKVPLTVPKTANQFIGYAETKKYVAYRSPTEGTWYLSALYNVLRSTRDDLNSTHTAAQRMVGEKVGRNKNQVQQPAFYSTLSRKLFLRPV